MTDERSPEASGEEISREALSDDERRELNDCLGRMLTQLAVVKQELRILRRYEGRVLGVARCVSLVDWLATAVGRLLAEGR